MFSPQIYTSLKKLSFTFIYNPNTIFHLQTPIDVTSPILYFVCKHILTLSHESSFLNYELN